MIDNIEHNVLKTVNAISTAATEVEQARKKKEEAQKVGHQLLYIFINFRARAKESLSIIFFFFRKNF